MIDKITSQDIRALASQQQIGITEAYRDLVDDRLLDKAALVAEVCRSRAIGTHDALFEHLADLIDLLVRTKAIQRRRDYEA